MLESRKVAADKGSNWFDTGVTRTDVSATRTSLSSRTNDDDLCPTETPTKNEGLF